MTLQHDPKPNDGRSDSPAVGRDEWLRVTLHSIGDGVITTDQEGRVTFLNPVAEHLTGWSLSAAIGQPLTEVFRIVNEETRSTVENPALRALREGLVVGLANHTLLIARDGTERPIDDSAAPIRDAHTAIAGVVLVFRDVTERRNAERQLRESEERFRLLVAGVQDYAIFPLDPDGRVIGWNLGAERIKGYASDEIIGMHFSIFYPHEDHASGKPERELRGAASTGRFEDEGWRLRKDGSRFWANVVITAMRDDHGTLKGFTKITRDMTAQKQTEDALRRSEERLRLLIGSSTDAIVSADASGTIIGWNEAAQLLFGYSEKEALGRPLTDLMPLRYRAAHELGLERFRRTGLSRLLGQTLELDGLRKDGSEFPLELSLSSFVTDKGRSFTGIIRGLAARRKLEAERAQAERDRTRAETLADINRRKDEFLAMLSHELRNPLAAVVNAVHILQLRKDDESLREQATDAIARQVDNLSGLVDDLLEISRITTGRIRLSQQDLDLRILVQRGVESLRQRIQENHQDLRVLLPDEPLWVHADAKRIEQVVVNLLSNATKYTEPGGRISVTLGRSGQDAVLSVRDTGVGITADLLPHVFETFRQAEASLERAEGGLGIGLSIVKQIVELHGGVAEAHSAGLGQGSEFLVRLPTVPSPTPPQKTQSQPSRTGRRLRILVVDDNVDAADTMALVLRLMDHDVQVTYSGTDGWNAARALPPQIALLDLGMPGMTGYELAQKFRSDPRLAKVKLIAVTGFGQEADRERGESAGFDVHLVKPVAPAQLQQVLEELAGVRERSAGTDASVP